MSRTVTSIFLCIALAAYPAPRRIETFRLSPTTPASLLLATQAITPPGAGARGVLSHHVRVVFYKAIEVCRENSRFFRRDPLLASLPVPYPAVWRLLLPAAYLDTFAVLAVPLIGRAMWDVAAGGAPNTLGLLVSLAGVFLAAEGLDPLRKFLDYCLSKLTAKFTEHLRLFFLAHALRTVDPLDPPLGIGNRIQLLSPKIAARSMKIPLQAKQAAFHVGMSAVLLGRLDPIVAGLTLLVGTSIAWWATGRQKRFAELSKTVQDAEAGDVAGLEELFLTAHLRQIRANALEDSTLAQWSARFATVFELEITAARAHLILSGVIDKINSFFLVACITLWGLGHLFFFREPSVGHILAVLSLSWHVYYRLGTLFTLSTTWRETESATQEMLGYISPGGPALDGSPPGIAASVAVRNLTYWVGKTVLLSHIELDVPAGSTCLIAGPPGLGKSTLLRLLAGLMSPTSGEIQIAGGPPSQNRQIVGYMDQETPFLNSLSLRENLQRFAPESTAEDLYGALVRAGWTASVEDALDVPAGHLSGGERKRAALAAVLLRRPRLLLLDEPAAGLDAASRERLEETLRSLQREGITLVIISHDPLDLPARRYHLDDGELRPERPFVSPQAPARFLVHAA